jgi:hypothetical protein
MSVIGYCHLPQHTIPSAARRYTDMSDLGDPFLEALVRDRQARLQEAAILRL